MSFVLFSSSVLTGNLISRAWILAGLGMLIRMAVPLVGNVNPTTTTGRDSWLGGDLGCSISVVELPSAPSCVTQSSSCHVIGGLRHRDAARTRLCMRNCQHTPAFGTVPPPHLSHFSFLSMGFTQPGPLQALLESFTVFHTILSGYPSFLLPTLYPRCLAHNN